MAKQIITMLTDDLDGSAADEIVTFALDGTGYVIDLNEKNAKELRESLEKFIQAASKTGRVSVNNNSYPSARRVETGSSTALSRQINQEIREWADRNGYHIADRGRIPTTVVEAFHAKRAAPTVDQQTAVIVKNPVFQPELITSEELEHSEQATSRPPAKKASPARKVARSRG